MRREIIYTIGLLPFIGSAQTVNEGQLSVRESTEVSTYFDFRNQGTGRVLNDGHFYFYDDYNNEGIFAHSVDSATGYVIFEGKSGLVQNISGSAPSDFANVLFNKEGGDYSFNLTNEILVNHLADFYEGVVFVNKEEGGVFTFLRGAVHENTSDDSHAMGQVDKEGEESFIYPIGKGGYYRFAGISSVAAVSGNVQESYYTGEYFLENSNNSYNHTQKAGVIELIDDKEYWVITPSSTTDGTLILTLSWDERTTPFDMYGDPRELRIVRWDEDTQMWLNEGGTVNPVEKTVTTPTQIDKYGVFTLGKVKRGWVDPGEVVIYDGVSPDGDGKNDYFYIENITRYPDNHVTIFNRWGREVYHTTNYDSRGNHFSGYAEGVKTFKNGEKLPTGTYYYIVEYTYENNSGQARRIRKAGSLHLENN